MTTQNLRISATLALNAIEEHLAGANIDWHDVAKMLRESLEERRENFIMPNIKLFDELEHTNGSTYIYIGKIGYRELLSEM